MKRLAMRCSSAAQNAVVTGAAEPEPLPAPGDRPQATVLSRIPYVFNDETRPYPPPCPDRPFAAPCAASLTGGARTDPRAGLVRVSCFWPGSPPLVVTLHDHGLRCPKKTLLRSDGECGTGIGAACATYGSGDQSALRRISLAAALSHSARKLVTHTSRFIAVSRSVARGLSGFGLIVPPTVFIVPNFLDVSDWASTSAAAVADDLVRRRLDRAVQGTAGGDRGLPPGRRSDVPS